MSDSAGVGSGGVAPSRVIYPVESDYTKINLSLTRGM